MWKFEINFIVYDFSLRHISGWVTVGGELEESEKTLSRKLWSRLHPGNFPWCIIGDFNKMLVQFKQLGGRNRPENQKGAFRSSIEDNKLFNLGYIGIFSRGVIDKQMIVLRRRD